MPAAKTGAGKGSTNKSSVAKPQTVKKPDPIPEDSVVTDVPVEEEKKKIVPKDIDLYQFIPVKNGTQGMLIFVNKRTGEEYRWGGFGDTQDIQLVDLRNAKSSSKAFFSENYFMFDDDYSWVIDYLGVQEYYKNALKLDRFDDVFTKPAEEVEEIIGKLSRGQKTAVAYRARQLIMEGKIDSNRVIATLERTLGINLVEK